MNFEYIDTSIVFRFAMFRHTDGDHTGARKLPNVKNQAVLCHEEGVPSECARCVSLYRYLSMSTALVEVVDCLDTNLRVGLSKNTAYLSGINGLAAFSASLIDGTHSTRDRCIEQLMLCYSAYAYMCHEICLTPISKRNIQIIQPLRNEQFEQAIDRYQRRYHHEGACSFIDAHARCNCTKIQKLIRDNPGVKVIEKRRVLGKGRSKGSGKSYTACTSANG